MIKTEKRAKNKRRSGPARTRRREHGGPGRLRPRKAGGSKDRKTPVRQRWLEKAYEDGWHDGVHMSSAMNEEWHRLANQHWNEWVGRTGFRAASWKEYHAAAKRYLEGYVSRNGFSGDEKILWSTVQPVAVVITAMNEEISLPKVLKQIDRLPFHQIIIVVNGSTDGTLEAARRCERAQILHYPEPLGHDVGRAIGAQLSSSEIVLFLDGDMVIPAESLIPFVQAVDRGLDVALNDISPFVGRFHQRDSVTILKEFVNRVQRRDDLKMNSLTAVPHALSRRALDTIGCFRLAVPPLAQAVAIRRGLRVGTAASIDVISWNRQRKENVGAMNPVSEMITGDHWEAMAYLLKGEGDRLKFPDWIRDRKKAEGGLK